MKTIYAMRHALHTNNTLSTEEEGRCVRIGEALKNMGVSFDRVMSSPQPRAMATMLKVMAGTGKMVPIRTDDSIGDAKLGLVFGDDEIAAIKAAAAAAGKDVEQFMLEYDTIQRKMKARGHQGAQVIYEMANGMNPGMTGAFASHGGSRLEVTIRHLAEGTGCEAAAAAIIFEPAGIARLTFGDDDQLVNVEYLGILA